MTHYSKKLSIISKKKVAYEALQPLQDRFKYIRGYSGIHKRRNKKKERVQATHKRGSLRKKTRRQLIDENLFNSETVKEVLPQPLHQPKILSVFLCKNSVGSWPDILGIGGTPAAFEFW